MGHSLVICSLSVFKMCAESLFEAPQDFTGPFFQVH